MTPCRIFPAEMLCLGGTPVERRVDDFVKAHQKSISHFERSNVTDQIFKVYVIFNNRNALDAFGKQFNCAGFSIGSKRLGEN